MSITLSDEARRYIALFEDATGAVARDCIVDDVEDRVVFVVAIGEMATAIGPDGRTVRGVEDRVGRRVELVENADIAEAFVANALAPAAVYDVQIEDTDGERVAVVEVDEADKGVAIGADGRNIQMARRLAARHFDIEDIVFAESPSD